MTDDNISKLPVKFKVPPSEDGKMLQVVIGKGCDHKWHFVNGKRVTAHYLIREGETEVECGLCGTRLDAMFVLMRLATEESRIDEHRKAYAEEAARLANRRRTKCEHCQKITRIRGL